MFMPVLNQSLAEKLHSIEVFANGYKLADIGASAFHIDGSPLQGAAPGTFTAVELSDPWVRVRPSSGDSTFHLRFTSQTPRRIYEYTEMQSPPPPERG